MKKNQSNLIMLNIIFVLSIVIANVVGCKVIDLGFNLFGLPLTLSGGAITYAFTFLCTDIISENYGKQEAKKAVRRGLVGQVFAIILIIVTQMFPAVDPDMQGAYVKLLGQSPMFTLGSLTAYYFSQMWDVNVFHKVREKLGANPRKRWIWNNLSTGTSQIIDTIVYASISFGLGLGWFFEAGMFKMLIGIMLGQYLLKLCLAILDTPIFYFFTRKTDDKEEYQD